MVKKGRVAVGMSGGVDSSVAATLLKEQGYEVTGVYIEAYNEPGCRSDQDRKDALAVVAHLDLRFKILDLRKEYKEKVVKYFLDEYQAGRTPNPDIVCNREIKFGLFYDWAISRGFDQVATGHYARITTYKDSPRRDLQGESFWLQRPRDRTKDQTYFLWQVPRKHLEHILFPLGDMLKSEVRTKAKEIGLPNADKPDSMGVCMMGELKVEEYLRKQLGENPGKVVLITKSQKFRSSPKIAQRSELWEQGSELRSIGTHRGLWFSTIGQRGGWEMEAKMQKAEMEPLHVVGKDREKNQLIVGTREETMTNEIGIDLSTPLEMTRKLWIRIRNLGELVAVTQCHSGTVTLEKPIFAPAEGQSAVFYDERGRVVGGGVIDTCNLTKNVP